MKDARLFSVFIFVAFACIALSCVHGQDRLVLKEGGSEVKLNGKFLPGSTYEVRLILDSKLDVFMDIANVETSCGCIVAKSESKTLSPGKSEEIVLKLTIPQEARRVIFGKTLKFKSCDTDSHRAEIMASVTCDVVPAAEVERIVRVPIDGKSETFFVKLDDSFRAFKTSLEAPVQSKFSWSITESVGGFDCAVTPKGVASISFSESWVENCRLVTSLSEKKADFLVAIQFESHRGIRVLPKEISLSAEGSATLYVLGDTSDGDLTVKMDGKRIPFEVTRKSANICTLKMTNLQSDWANGPKGLVVEFQSSGGGLLSFLVPVLTLGEVLKK